MILCCVLLLDDDHYVLPDSHTFLPRCMALVPASLVVDVVVGGAVLPALYYRLRDFALRATTNQPTRQRCGHLPFMVWLFPGGGAFISTCRLYHPFAAHFLPYQRCYRYLLPSLPARLRWRGIPALARHFMACGYLPPTVANLLLLFARHRMPCLQA